MKETREHVVGQILYPNENQEDVKNKDRVEYRSLGASGAVSGIVIAMIAFHPMDMRVWGMPGWLFALVFLFGSSLLSRRGGGKINHDAHLCGALSGLVFVGVTDPAAFGRFLAILSG